MRNITKGGRLISINDNVSLSNSKNGIPLITGINPFCKIILNEFVVYIYKNHKTKNEINIDFFDIKEYQKMQYPSDNTLFFDGHILKKIIVFYTDKKTIKKIDGAFNHSFIFRELKIKDNKWEDILLYPEKYINQ